MLDKLRSTTYNLLRKSEKFFQTDMVYLAKGSFWLTLGQIISSLSSFLLAIAFANLLPKEVYGTYKYVLSLVGMLSVFTLSGMNTSLTRSVARGFEGDLKPILKEKIKWGSIGSLVSLGIAIYYYLNGNLTLTIGFVIATVFLPLMDPLNIYVSFLNGRKNFKLASKYDIITKIISTALMILVLIFSKNIFLILFTYFISYTLCRFIFLKITLQKQEPNSKKEPGTISYGKHLSLMNIIGSIVAQIDKLLIWHFIGPTELAIYSIAIAPLEQIKGMLKKISTLAFPKFSQKSLEGIKKNIFQKIMKAILITFLISIIYIIISPIFYKLFFPQYEKAIFYSQIFSLSLFTIINWIPLGVLKAHEFTKKIYLFKILSPSFKIIILYPLIIKLGLLGIVISIIISRLFDLLLSIFLLKKAKKFKNYP